MKKIADSHERLCTDIIACGRCVRLRSYCAGVARDKRKSYAAETYWGQPVPGFGDPTGKLLIVGLTPAAHGANRTGRMFTGDRSGQWLYRALFRSGFANQASFEHAKDGLELKNCLVTTVGHCAPPDNKPRLDEIANCADYLTRTFDLLKPRIIVALGAIAWKGVFKELKSRKLWSRPPPRFAHGVEIVIHPHLVVIGSYHPSQQNTFTKRLTEPMFDSIFTTAKKLL